MSKNKEIVPKVIENEDGTKSVNVDIGEIAWENLVNSLGDAITGIKELANTINVLMKITGDTPVVKGYRTVYTDLNHRYKSNLKRIEDGIKNNVELDIETYIDIETDISSVAMETAGVMQDVLADLVANDIEISNSDVIQKMMKELEETNKELFNLKEK